MCGVCGCGESDVKIEGMPVHSHNHAHSHDHSNTRLVQVETDILAENNRYAASNRQYFSDNSILALNLVSSPGSGKTSLLTRTIQGLKGEVDITVIEGDQQTTNDAERIRQTGVKAIQVNTGKGCHLDAHMIAHAVETLAPAPRSTLFIENVGNLVCPAGFDLGEAHKVVILSVTEGEDKPIKYPDMFHASDVMLLNKIDLLPYLDFDVEKCLEYAHRINPKLKIFQLSATTGEGMDQWVQWIKSAQPVSSIDVA